MDANSLKILLESIKNGEISVEQGMNSLKKLPFENIEFAKPDHHRNIRNGYPEVVYCQGKSLSQIKAIMQELMKTNNNIMATRADIEVYEAIKEVDNTAVYYDLARIVVAKRKDVAKSNNYIAVVSAGTSDMAVAEEASVTAEVMGNTVKRVYDVGVAGIHRLFANKDILMEANCLIVVAGMDGALAGVVGGLVDRPVIAVPTSIGYGANFGGLAALLSMLNNCASGVAVVNIDNGFGAGYLASMINKLN